jgi:phosphohistidine phosphatase
MKTFVLVRHAKSSWKNRELADRDRPLNPRGRREAPEMGRRLATRGATPDQIVTSPALRAATTASVFAEAVGYPEREIVEDERLYDAGWREILDVIRGVEDRFDRVFLFGHNPGLTDLVNELSDEPIRNMPTCGVMEFRIACESWSDVRRDTVMRVDFDYPKRRD